MEKINVYRSLTVICKKWFKHMLFGITFVKKNGEVRDILCMFKPKTWKGIPTTNGGSLNWNPTERGYLHVFDCIKGGWRMVNLETIQSIRFGRKSYNFENFKHFSEFMLVMGKWIKIEDMENLEIPRKDMETYFETVKD